MLAFGAFAASGALVAPSSIRSSSVVRSGNANMGLVDAVSGLFGSKKQDFLEADPYYDQSNIPAHASLCPARLCTRSACQRP